MQHYKRSGGRAAEITMVRFSSVSMVLSRTAVLHRVDRQKDQKNAVFLSFYKSTVRK